MGSDVWVQVLAVFPCLLKSFCGSADDVGYKPLMAKQFLNLLLPTMHRLVSHVCTWHLADGRGLLQQARSYASLLSSNQMVSCLECLRILRKQPVTHRRTVW